MLRELIIGLVSVFICVEIMANDWPEEVPGSVSDRPLSGEKHVKIYKPDVSKNLLANAGFEEGRAHWVLAKHHGARATYFLDTLHAMAGQRSAVIHVYSATGKKNDIQLFQRFPVQKLTEYFITFSASVSEETSISVSIFNDFNTIWSEKITLLKGDHTYGPIRFFSQTADAFTMLGFAMGESTARIALDNISTHQDQSALDFEKVKGRTGLNVYYQQGGVVRVQLPIAQTEEVPLIVSDSLGRLVASGTFRAGSTTLELTMNKKFVEVKGLVFTAFLGDVIMTRHITMGEMVADRTR